MHRLVILIVLASSASIRADEPPVIPVGPDAYRMWDRWAHQRIGARAYMRSTYDRTGGNRGPDASHFLYQLADDHNVTLDVAGAGVLYFARYNHWHGSPWHYVVDGIDHIISETSTADPNKPAANSTFLPQAALPNPLTWTWSDTRGADLMWVPIGFEKSFQMAYSRTRYGTGYYIYHQFVPGAPLSQPIRAWDARTPPADDVLDLLRAAGTDIAPPGNLVQGKVTIPAAGELRVTRLAALDPSGGTVRALTFSAPKSSALALSNVRLRITWDDRAEPSVDAPLALFFGAGTLYNRDGREHLVKALPVNVQYADDDRVHLACYFPMPFFRSATISLAGVGEEIADVKWTARFAPLTVPKNHVGYFHATYRDHPTPEPGQDMVLLDTRTIEGGGDWTGSFVGTSFIFSHNAVLTTLEGDPRFFFDDSNSPQAQGTGTEEWGGGGDYWGGRNMTLPLAGHPCGAPSAKDAKDEHDKIQSAYRFLLADLMPFGRNARICLEHGSVNESKEHYETVTYWYGLPGASLVPTDELKIGDDASEKAHAYASPDASAPYPIKSRYELGPHELDGKETYPAHEDVGRVTKTTSEFTLKLRSDNFGALLRRKLDYAYPNQRAEVFVADASDGARDPEWKPAGVWYLAGSNTCVYSNPREELGETQHTVIVSNRRFRDDEFLIARDLTQGRSAVRVRVKFTPVNIPLFPGYPLTETAWSEIKYSAYCFVMPPMP
ncbi:MAG: DUF2961 domain-containing protein [Tepidisphaeraceae bacterium]